MKMDLQKIKIDKAKKNAVIIGDSFDLTDLLEIYLYQKYNVITAINEFDGMEKIGHFEPSVVFIKCTSNNEAILAFMPKLQARHSRDIPVIVYTKEEISTINEFSMKTAGIRELIKFPIEYKDFGIIMRLCVKD